MRMVRSIAAFFSLIEWLARPVKATDPHVRQSLNELPLNRKALQWLERAREYPNPSVLYLFQLSAWGLEQEIHVYEYGGGGIPHHEVESQTHLLLTHDPERQKNAYEWLLSTPNGPDTEEQETTLLDRKS